jgi:hypothetical protein
MLGQTSAPGVTRSCSCMTGRGIDFLNYNLMLFICEKKHLYAMVELYYNKDGPQGETNGTYILE